MTRMFFICYLTIVSFRSALATEACASDACRPQLEDDAESSATVSLLQHSVAMKSELQAESDRTKARCSDTPNNQREFLVPPDGTAWRGSTQGWAKEGQMLSLGYDDNADDDPSTFEAKYGKPLHVYRVFRGKGNAKLGDDEARVLPWVKAGGIVFYSIYSHEYADFVSGKLDWAIQAWAKRFKMVAPAKMFISVRYEPELYAIEDQGTGTFGTVKKMKQKKFYFTPAQYRELWQYVWHKFEDAGVTNAVWAIDYSVDGATQKPMLPLAAALWPGDKYVDWLLWNYFTFAKQKDHYDDSGSKFGYWIDHAYKSFEEYSGVPLEWDGVNYTANWKAAKAWGLGAWGANSVKPWMEDSEEARVRLLADAETAFNSGKYPRLKLSCHFDTYADVSSEIGNATWRRSGTFTDTAAVEDGGPSNKPLFDAYVSLVDSPAFNANDVALCSTTTKTTTTTTMPATTMPATTGPCASWCEKQKIGPEKWCNWKKCKGCPVCLTK